MEYVLNEKLKRLEPTETLCYYCNKAHSTKMDDNYFVKLYKEKGRTNVIVYRNVKFNVISIGIPRCPSCKKIHVNSKGDSIMYSILIVIFVIVASFYIWGGMGILVFFVIIPIGLFSQYAINKKLVASKNILSEKEGAKKSDTVKEFIISGWSFNAPSA